MEVHDLRFPTSKDLSGSDAVHKDPDVSSLAKIVLACGRGTLPEESFDPPASISYFPSPLCWLP